MKKKGISLIVLIITIIVIIILAASIILNLTNTNIIGNANEAVLKSDIATLQSELELYVSDRFVDEKGKYDRVKLNADYETATYGTENIPDKNGDGESNVYDILTVLKKSKWDKKVYVKEGVLVFKNDGLTKEEIEVILGTGSQVEGIPQIKEISAQSGYTNITVSLDVEEADKVEKYIYIFNDGEREESTETIKTYTGLTADTNYMFEVIAVLSNGIEISKKQIISTKSLNGKVIYTRSETEWTKNDVTVEISFSEELPEGYELQYKLSGGMTQEWTAYTGAVTITENATTLVGRVYNSTLVEEKVGSSVVIANIDKDVPTVPEELKLTSGKDSITATASGSTDATSGVEYYEYSIDNKTWQTKDTFTGLEIGEYTIYARAVDMAGNVSEVKTGTVEVKIQIEITVEYVDLLNAKITIDYGNVSNPEYKIGTNGTWQTYEDTFTINSQDIINNKLYNEDYTLTIYARGTSTSGVQGSVDTVIDKMDLQAPEAPVIDISGSEYPTLTEYGVVLNANISITYPENVTKLYSLDGEKWQEYTGEFESNGGKVYAKSMKESGLANISEVIVKGTASDALSSEAYDGDETTYATSDGRINVSPEMQGKTIYFNIQANGTAWTYVWGDNKSSAFYSGPRIDTSTKSLTIPLPSSIGYLNSWGHGFYLKEIQVKNEPIITPTKYYPTITENGVVPGYNEVEIEYFQTSVQKLYKIDDGDWQEYTGAVRLEIGETIYAKGIDKNNNETRIVSEYIAVLPDDALSSLAYDRDETTYATSDGRINVSPEMQGKTIYFNIQANGTAWTYVWGDNKSSAFYSGPRIDTSTNSLTIPLPSSIGYLNSWGHGFYLIEIEVEQ